MIYLNFFFKGRGKNLEQIVGSRFFIYSLVVFNAFSIKGLNPPLKSMRKTARFYSFLFRNKKSCYEIQPYF